MSLMSTSDPVRLRDARVVSGPRCGLRKHGVYHTDGSQVLNAALIRGRTMIDGFAAADDLAVISERIEGRFVYGGCVMNHFGHMLIETFARLASFYNCDETILFSSLTEDEGLFWTFVEATGLPKERIRVLRRSCIVDDLLVPAPDMRPRASINLPFIHAYEALGAGVAASARIRQNSNPTPVYLSRTQTKRDRRYHFGETLIEELMRQQGAEVLYMEQMPMKQQFAEILSRQIIVGFAGSAFHTILLCRGPRMIRYLTTNTRNGNFRLIDALKPNDAQDVRLEVVPPPRRRERQGPFLLTKAAIARAASTLGEGICETRVDARAYAACIEQYRDTLAELDTYED